MEIWRYGTDIAFRFRSDEMDVSSVVSVQCEMKLSEGKCVIPAQSDPVKLSFTVTPVASTGPTDFPSWEISATHVQRDALADGEYVYDVLVEFTGGKRDRSPPYFMKLVGGVT